MSSEKTYSLPPTTVDTLRALWARANGGAEIAAAAQQAAKAMFDLYQERFGLCLEMLGVDPKEKWWIDFKTGEVHEGDPPSRADNGGEKLLSVSPESNAVQTNGRAT